MWEILSKFMLYKICKNIPRFQNIQTEKGQKRETEYRGLEWGKREKKERERIKEERKKGGMNRKTDSMCYPVFLDD